MALSGRYLWSPHKNDQRKVGRNSILAAASIFAFSLHNGIYAYVGMSS